jgi:hypothetical protein
MTTPTMPAVLREPMQVLPPYAQTMQRTYSGLMAEMMFAHERERLEREGWRIFRADEPSKGSGPIAVLKWEAHDKLHMPMKRTIAVIYWRTAELTH